MLTLYRSTTNSTTLLESDSSVPVKARSPISAARAWTKWKYEKVKGKQCVAEIINGHWLLQPAILEIIFVANFFEVNLWNVYEICSVKMYLTNATWG